MLEDQLEKEICVLHSEGKWREIIALGESKENHEFCRLLWVWPTLSDLNWIKDVIVNCNIQGIVSIGCGTGLLEWLIQQHSHCHVIGLEVDKPWWTSKYSPPLFLEEILLDNNKPTIPDNFAYLFCYFNNGQAFYDYMNNYHGKVLLIIGPGDDQNRCTDPLPFDEKLMQLGWLVRQSRKLDNNRDHIVVYTKI